MEILEKKIEILDENIDCYFIGHCSHKYCNVACPKRIKFDDFVKKSLIPEDRLDPKPLYTDADGADANAFLVLKNIEDKVADFVNEGKNLYIFSNRVGNGKTSWALRIATRYLKTPDAIFGHMQNIPVLFISVPRYLLELKSSITQKSEYIEHINEYAQNASLVVWDDIGSKNGTEFEVSHLLSLIDQRINNGKSNIYTSNLNSNELHEMLGDRIYSRVFNYSLCINIVGKDKRGIKQ